MTRRTALVCLGAVTAVILAGCGSDSTDVSKSVNDAYHNHDAGPRPPAGAMKPGSGPVGPFAKTGGVPPNAPKAPISGEGVGPGGSPAKPGGQ